MSDYKPLHHMTIWERCHGCDGYDCKTECAYPGSAARIRELLAQLPSGMEHCTIEFKECEHGHGRLVATNWVDHGCHFCRIRELEATLKESDCINEDQAARIRELEAELDALKSDLSGYMNAANTYVNELHGVHTGTHVIVPVEPTQQMAKAIHAAIDEAWDHPDVAVCLYRAMIRAAQPEQQQGE